jgi:asparagine synthase (glutamine-hydrolysing)
MCGFVAVVSTNGGSPVAGTLSRMTDLLSHRGPDDRGIFVEGAAGLGFRRLSILDLAASGHQPMRSADGRHVIVFNGEIYNYVELRAELQALGHQFRSTGDTEVLLAAYRQWGRECLPRLNGMWAFVVYDRVEKRFFGARDRFGVKPLFWYRDADSIVFASEIKALRDSGYARLEIDWRTVAAYVLEEDRLDSEEATFYRNVRHVPAGAAFEVDAGGHLTWHAFWSLEEASQALSEPAEPPAEYARLFEDAVRVRLRADVPVGVLLSGGLDSTSIICSMARALAEVPGAAELNAFSYMSAHYDETPYIEATLRQTGARLWRMEEPPTVLWNDLERYLWYQDEPVYSFTSVVGYQLMRLARSRGVKVLLNGQGADEVLAGYPSYVGDYWADLMARGRLWALAEEYRAHARRLGRPATRRHLERSVGMAAGRILHCLPGYAGAARRRQARRLSDGTWLTPEVHREWRAAEVAAPTSLYDNLRRSVEYSPLPRILRVEDRNSMAYSVEARLPFLDYRLVALSFRLGSQWKVRGPYGKFLIREAMQGRIPENVRTRADKFGFPTSADAWFRGELLEPFRDLLRSRGVREAGLWDTAAVERALERHCRGEVSLGGRLFDVAQLALWMDGSRRWPREATSRSEVGAVHALAT